MAEPSGSELNVDWFGLRSDVVDVSDWTVDEQSCWFINRRNAASRQNRANIVHAIIHNRSTHHLRTILESDWDLNEVLNMPDHVKNYHSLPQLYHKMAERTALHQAARQGWTEGVKMLLDAGAKCLTSEASEETPMILALHNPDCPVDIIELLLKHGADPNDHDGFIASIPLFKSIYGSLFNSESSIKIVELLLMHEADPNEPSRSKSLIHSCPLHAVIKLFSQFMHRINDRQDFTDIDQRLSAFKKANVEVFKTLVNFGADVNWNEGNSAPVLHKLAGQHFHRDTFALPRSLYLPDHLDLFFQHGGNINMADGEDGTALEYAAAACGHSNSIRWLIRHGADTTPLRLTLLKGCIFPLVRIHQQYQGIETPLILLNAGMNVSEETRACLINIEETIVHEASEAGLKQAEAMWHQLAKAEFLENKDNARKCNFPEYLSQQLVDLQEFSDVSLHIYPKEVVRNPGHDRQFVLDQIHTILEFRAQPQSLQWYCRRCVRENLVSLQPSVVKTLNIPVGLKRYILCHEI